MPAEDAIFRNSMRLLASGVTIVASVFEGRRSGLTATAVCSLALAPARILASINMQGHTYGIAMKSRCMSVNLLANDHEHLAAVFAAKRAAEDSDRFVHGNWTARVTGAPILTDALAALDCRVTEIIPLDTHAILIGEVEDILFGPYRPPLIHFEGGFTSIGSHPEKSL
ncbi:MAG TPA: flavin reductase family protein [Micropepsaceae bacterium]|nr:flavin reductase family protein [Micropepsaceae bacterium]